MKNTNVTMHIKKIIIRNYRALEDIEMNFNASMNILYGTNAAGKSSVIMMITNFLYMINHPEGIASNLFLFDNFEIQDQSKDCFVSLSIETPDGVKTLTASRNTEAIQNYQVSQPEKTEPIMHLWQKEKTLLDGTILKGDYDYFKTSYFTIPLLIPGMSPPSSHICQGTHTSNDFIANPNFATARGIPDYKGFRIYFERLENEENQRKIEESDFTIEHPTLKLIRKTIISFNPQFENMRIDRKKEGGPLCIDKNGLTLDIATQLSHGEASVITMLGHLCISYASPHTQKSTIAIIDEVDTSLHPTWQTKIAHILQQSMPHVQFILSSHSPFIWMGAKKENVIHLKKDTDNKTYIAETPYAVGGDIQSIITEFFEVDSYDENIAKDIYAIEDLISLEDKKNALAAMEKLKNKCGDLPVLNNLEGRIRTL